MKHWFLRQIVRQRRDGYGDEQRPLSSGFAGRGARAVGAKGRFVRQRHSALREHRRNGKGPCYRRRAQASRSWNKFELLLQRQSPGVPRLQSQRRASGFLRQRGRHRRAARRIVSLYFID